jgi:hypothetical protein
MAWRRSSSRAEPETFKNNAVHSPLAGGVAVRLTIHSVLSPNGNEPEAEDEGVVLYYELHESIEQPGRDLAQSGRFSAYCSIPSCS